MFTADQLSNIKSSPLPVPAGLDGVTRSDSVNPLGGTAGVYYDWKNFGPVRLGFDARGTILNTKRGAYEDFNGPGAKMYSALGGVRATFHTRYRPLKPYIQGSAGWARSNYGLSTDASTASNNCVGNAYFTPSCGPTPLYNNFEWQALAGLDIKLLPIMDWRAVELGYGGLDPFGDNGHNYPVKQISTGLVFHLPF